MSVGTDPMAIPMFDELLKRLGDIPPHRICLLVPPGKATEKDVLRLQDHTNRNFELVEGTLVEKPVSQFESSLTMDLGGHLWSYLRTHPRGYITGPDGGARVLAKLIRMPDISFIDWSQLPTRETQHRCLQSGLARADRRGPKREQHTGGDATQAQGILPRRHAPRLDRRSGEAHRRGLDFARRVRDADGRGNARRRRRPAGFPPAPTGVVRQLAEDSGTPGEEDARQEGR